MDASALLCDAQSTEDDAANAHLTGSASPVPPSPAGVRWYVYENEVKCVWMKWNKIELYENEV
jgi:hypothetical protein